MIDQTFLYELNNMHEIKRDLTRLVKNTIQVLRLMLSLCCILRCWTKLRLAPHILCSNSLSLRLSYTPNSLKLLEFINSTFILLQWIQVSTITIVITIPYYSFFFWKRLSLTFFQFFADNFDLSYVRYHPSSNY